MGRFAFRKGIAAIITIIAILCVNFVIFRIAPGDPVRMMFKDPRVSAKALELQRIK
jgi:peptide/nickel transport system permease protein